jgi:hypothetical protein
VLGAATAHEDLGPFKGTLRAGRGRMARLFGAAGRAILGDGARPDEDLGRSFARVESLFQVWRSSMAAVFYDAPLDAQFLDLVHEWVMSNPMESAHRLQELADLSRALQRPASSRGARLKTLREWVESRMTAPAELRRRALEQLHRMEQAAAWV